MPEKGYCFKLLVHRGKKNRLIESRPNFSAIGEVREYLAENKDTYRDRDKYSIVDTCRKRTIRWGRIKRR